MFTVGGARRAVCGQVLRNYHRERERITKESHSEFKVGRVGDAELITEGGVMRAAVGDKESHSEFKVGRGGGGDAPCACGAAVTSELIRVLSPGDQEPACPSESIRVHPSPSESDSSSVGARTLRLQGWGFGRGPAAS